MPCPCSHQDGPQLHIMDVSGLLLPQCAVCDVRMGTVAWVCRDRKGHSLPSFLRGGWWAGQEPPAAGTGFLGCLWFLCALVPTPSLDRWTDLTG